MRGLVFIVWLVTGFSPVFADSGKQVYETFCIACHGANGEGVKGAAPPLAQSEWVSGPADRIANILLHGLQGKLTIHQQSYDLVMPPQVALNTQQIADVANYVRSQWGNYGETVSKGFIEEVKEREQSGMWQATKLAKKHRLNKKPTKMKQLLSESFGYVEDLSSLTNMSPDAIEEENSGFIATSQAGNAKEAFSAKWTGKLNATKAGTYFFSVCSDDKAQIWINGELLVSSLHPEIAKGSSIKLNKGEIELEVRYSHRAKTSSKLLLYWSGPGFDMKPLHTVARKKVKIPSIVLAPESDRALVHRNFFHKDGYRSLAVGFPGGVNFVFSVDHLNLESLWSGKFIEVGNTWHGRAKGEIATAANKMTVSINAGQAAYKELKGKPSKWEQGKEPERRFLGYEYADKGQVIFIYQVGEVVIKESFSPSADGKSLTRVIRAKQPVQNLFIKVSDTAPNGDKELELGGGLFLQVSEEAVQLSDGAVIRVSEKPLTLTYNWK